MSDLVNCPVATVTVPPSPLLTGTKVTVAGLAEIPTLPAKGTFWPAGEAATQTNSEVVEVTANSAGEFTIIRKVQGPMGARAIQVGDQFAFMIMSEHLLTPPATSAKVFCSPLGNDSYSGGSWAFPKKTIQAAHDALPETGELLPNGKPVRHGTIELSAALGTVASPAFVEKSELRRFGFAKFPGGKTVEEKEGKKRKAKGKPFVQVNMSTGEAGGSPALTGCSAADIGLILINPEAPSGALEAAEITDFWEGEINSSTGARVTKAGTGKTFYTISKYVGKNIGEMLYVVKPVAKFSPGVRLVGQGPTAAVPGHGGRHAPYGGTVIEDLGNGLTFWVESGTPRTPVEARNIFSDFTLRAKHRPYRGEAGAGEYNNNTAIWGWFFNNVFGVAFERLNVLGYTGWGIYAGNNGGEELLISFCVFVECGNIVSKIGPAIENQMTGCFSSAIGTPIQAMYSSLFLNGFGCCARINGMHAVACVFNHASASTFIKESSTKEVAKSGSNVIAAGGGVNPSSLTGGWMEGGKRQVESAGFVTLIGIHFQGIPGESNATTNALEENEEEVPEWSPTEEYNQGEFVEWTPGTSKGSGVWESLINENIGHEPKKESEFWSEVSVAEYAIVGGANIHDCYFRKYTKACIKESGQPGKWSNCRLAGPHSEKTRTTAFVEKQGKAPNVPLYAAYGEGRYGGKEEEGGEVVGANVTVTVAFQPEEVVMETTIGGFKYTNTNGYDVWLEPQITFPEAGSTVTREMVFGESWAQAYPPEEASTGKRVVAYYIKAGETIKLTLTKATITGGKAIVRWA